MELSSGIGDPKHLYHDARIGDLTGLDHQVEIGNKKTRRKMQWGSIGDLSDVPNTSSGTTNTYR